MPRHGSGHKGGSRKRLPGFCHMASRHQWAACPIVVRSGASDPILDWFFSWPVLPWSVRRIKRALLPVDNTDRAVRQKLISPFEQSNLRPVDWLAIDRAHDSHGNALL
jgi:hypothetical protein